jgi:hypothetical protein
VTYWPRPALAILAMLAVLWALLAAAVAQAPIAAPEQRTMLCGSEAEQLRVLDRERFQPTWRGEARDGGSAVIVVNEEGYWVLLLLFGDAPDRACVASDGPASMSWPAGRE